MLILFTKEQVRTQTELIFMRMAIDMNPNMNRSFFFFMLPL